jgi:hypothetical protein
VSIDLAVWEGPAPPSDKQALQEFLALYDRYIESDDQTPPTAAIAEYVAVLLSRYPDLTTLDDASIDESPWSDGPLIDNAVGPFMYFGFVRNAALEPAWTFAVETGRSMGLVCFDPQSERLAQA